MIDHAVLLGTFLRVLFGIVSVLFLMNTVFYKFSWKSNVHIVFQVHNCTNITESFLFTICHAEGLIVFTFHVSSSEWFLHAHVHALLLESYIKKSHHQKVIVLIRSFSFLILFFSLKRALYVN